MLEDQPKPTKLPHWKRFDTPTVCDGYVVRYKFGLHQSERGFEISASRNRVSLSGFYSCTNADELRAVLTWAEFIHAQLHRDNYVWPDQTQVEEHCEDLLYG